MTISQNNANNVDGISFEEVFGDLTVPKGMFKGEPLFDNGPDALLGFLRATKNTPVVGANVYQFAVKSKTKKHAEKFVQRLRTTLGKRRKSARDAGVVPAKFTVQLVDILLDEENGYALIALGRRQKAKRATGTTSLETLALIADKELSHSREWQELMVELETQEYAELSARDWNRMSLGVIMVKQGNAVYRGYNEINSTHLISLY